MVAAGRGSGKTELARRRIVRWLPVKKPWHNPMYFYAMPTYKHAKRVAWKEIKLLVPPEWIKNISESDLCIETIYGSSLYVVGMDKPQRIEGDQWDGGVIDENSDQRPGMFSRSVLPALSHKNGWCWRIGVPKRFGIGAMEFKAEFDKAKTGKDPEAEAYTWPSSDILTPDQLRYAMENNDPRDYNEQYNATWEEAAGRIFYAYDDKLNVSLDAMYNPNWPLFIGQDFNVNPMCWVVGHMYSSYVDIIDELFIRNTNTQSALDELYKRYGTHEAGFAFYGDASGKARKTSASNSDIVIIKNDRRFKNKTVNYLRSNPPVTDRFAACNAVFCNAAQDRRCKVHPRCIHLRNDLLHRAFREGTREPNDYGDMGHMSDAFGYPIYVRFPIRPDVLKEKPEVHLAFN